MTVEAGHMMMQRHPLARPKTPDARAGADNGAGGFVAEDARRRQEAVLDFLDVGGANAARGHADEQFTGADARHGHGFEPQRVRPAVHDRPHGRGGHLLRFPDHPSVHDREEDARLVNIRRVDPVEVAVEHDEVGEFAGAERAFGVLGKLGVGRADGVGADGLVQRDFLIGKPAVGMLAVQSLARDRRLEAEHRIERGDGPVRAKGQHRPGVEQRAEGIGAPGAFGADAFFAPAPVIGGVVGLHRGNDLLAAEAGDVGGAQMLGVFDAEAAVAGAVLLGDLAVEIEDARVGPVADGVDHHLQAEFVRGRDALEHDALGQHLLEEQAAGVRRVPVRLEEERRSGAQAAVGKPLEAANAQPVVAERRAHARLGQDLP